VAANGSLPRLQRNNGKRAPRFRHARAADYAEPAIFSLHPPAAIIGRVRWIGGPCAEPGSGQAGDETVCRKLRVLPSQPARAEQRALSPHALSLSATTLFQRIELGLGAHQLSGISRQREARCDEIGWQDRGFAVALAATAGAGTGALAQQSPFARRCATKVPQDCHLFDLCSPSILSVRVAGSNGDGGD
jgi:hypothetical protein